MSDWCYDSLIPARDIKVVRPLYGVELFDGETARFEVEISEDDVHGQWKLKDEVLTSSPVSSILLLNIYPNIFVFIFLLDMVFFNRTLRSLRTVQNTR